jgi:hypothetical protein
VVATALAVSIAVGAGLYLRAQYAAERQIAVGPAPGASAAAESGTPPTSASPDVLPPQVEPTPVRPSRSLVQSDEHFEPVTPTNPPPTIPPVTPPPDRSLHVSSRYRQHYDARSASWDDVIDSGRNLPSVSARCARNWRNSGRDKRLDWDSAEFLCMDSLSGRGFRPQGVGGSATTERYFIGGQPASNRNLILTSWYSRAEEPGLFAPRRGGSVTRLVVMDMDQRRYNTVELVRPDGSRTLRSLNSHGSGLVWAGQYIYSSSHAELFMFNADDIMKIDGRYVLPAVARWTVSGHGGLSSISIDRSATPDRLRGINYTKSGQAYMQSFELAGDGSLAANGRRTDRDLVLTNRFGQRGPAVHSISSVVVPGGSFQGVAGAGAFGFANSSSLRIDGRKGVDAVAVLRGGKVVERFRMPHGNGQSIYIDYRRGTYVSLTERYSQFLYQMPLKKLTTPAR